MTASDELRRAEAVAAAMNRGLKIDPIGWEELLAIAQKEIGQFQQRRSLDVAVDLYDEEEATPLMAAARIIQEVALNQLGPDLQNNTLDLEKITSPDSRSESKLLLILSSCAFAMYGNFPSSAAVQRLLNLSEVSTEGQWLALAVCNPRIIAIALRATALSITGREFLEELNYFLKEGDELVGDKLIIHFETLMGSARPASDIVFLRCARLALKHITKLAIANLHRGARGEIFNGFVKQLIEDGRHCLLPPQYTLITDQNVLDEFVNTIITIPTSTGKTLLAELAIAARLKKSNDVAIYVTPYIALGRQVFECFQRHVPKGVNVHGYFGNFNTSVGFLKLDKPTIIVVTPERLDAILRTQNIYPNLRTIVFDEAHGIENGLRGARLESLITRVRLQQRRHSNLRIILLSAVLTEVKTLQRWLGENSLHCHDTWRPTTRRLGIWNDNGILAWLYGADPLRPADRNAGDIVGSKKLPMPEFTRPAESFQAIQSQRPAVFRNAAFLARYLLELLGGPILLACATKANTRGLAGAIASALPPIEEPARSRDAICELIKLKYPHLTSLAEMISKGVAYHNASLPGEIKTAIEDAVKARTVQFVAATTTLAEGVDLPFRITILFDWLIGFKENQSPMSSLLFRNIAGRCGRAGEFTEGDTIIFDNTLGNFQFTSPGRRHLAQAGILSDPKPLDTVFANDNLEGESRSEIRSLLSSQLLASIPENPHDDNIESDWAKSTYAAYRDRAPEKLLLEIRNELLSTSDGESFAKAASPMWLTPLGEAANRTGFGTKTCRKLLNYLEKSDVDLSDEEIACNLIYEFGDCDEQSNYLLSDIVSQKRTTFYVKADDLLLLATGWLDGSSLTDIFLSLPRAKTSKAATSPAEWAAGGADYEPVVAQYDKFVDVIEYTFGSFLPWIVRGLNELRPLRDTMAGRYDWATFAERFETGRIIDEQTLFGKAE